MVNIYKLTFEITLSAYNDIDELGNNLAKWLEESWLNGEDTIEVKYKKYEEVL